MEFKKIQLNGFKSFADKTNFLIEEGLTGIVGPNGCGKSNIVESLRWVMGETSAKSMRGSGMEDVIFNGTSNKASKNIAEVSINVENKNNEGPVQYRDLDQISVRRKIEKDKGSKFYINDKEVRARDAQMFFADLSTGAHSPSMISQGRIGALVTAKPTDRRAILEEAAGISGLHVRRHEAELRLGAAENNLKRADELRRQQEKQLANLQKQAEEATKYKLISEEIKKIEAGLYYLKLLEIDKEINFIKGSNVRTEELAKLGNKVGADYIIVTSLQNINNKTIKTKLMGETISTKQSEIDLTVSIIDIATSQIIFSDSMSLSQAGGSLSKFSKLVAERLARKITDTFFPAKLIAFKNNQLTVDQGNSFFNKKSTYNIIKLGPRVIDQTLNQFSGRVENIVGKAMDIGFSGVIAANTSVNRFNRKEFENFELGGLSGKPIETKSVQIIKFLAKLTDYKFPIIGVGGISNTDSAIRKLDAGACLLQIYSSLVYQGPSLPSQLTNSLNHRARKWN